MMNRRIIFSFVFRIITVVFGIIGVVLSCINLKNGNALLFFTIQSNIWVIAFSLFQCVYFFLAKFINKKLYHILELVFVVSITLTGVVFCFVLAPTGGKEIWAIENVFTHVIVPVSAVAGYLFDVRPLYYQKAHVFYCLLPALYYLVLATIGYNLKWNFIDGLNYPYFFLDFASHNGPFGIDKEGLGSFYWIVFLALFIIGVSFLLRYMSHIINTKRGKTVLCYIEKDGNVLMLLRNKEKNDINEGKWIGIGGHIEKNETPEEALLREVKEETNLAITHFISVGNVKFHSELVFEQMYVYYSDSFSGDLIECDEGTLKWIETKKIMDLNLWEGDRYFLPLIFDNKCLFDFSFYYKKDKLIRVKRNDVKKKRDSVN